MPSTEQDRYILHLNHALAMESALVDHLEKRAKEISDPKIKQRVEEHRSETMDHRDTVRGIIESLHGAPTASKATVQPPISPGVIGSLKTALEGEKTDRALTEALADYAVENFEAGLYLALAQMARNLGHAEHAGDYDRIRRQEESMAQFLAGCEPQMVDQAFPPSSGLRAA